MSHLNEAHDQTIAYEELTFESDDLFKEWLCKQQRDEPCYFVRKRLGHSDLYYTCNRSLPTMNMKNISIPRKRRLKVHGYSYCGFTCPAHIKRYNMGSGHIKVQYQRKHFCNTNKLWQFGYLRFSESDRQWFISRLALQIPFSVIIQEARSNINNQLERKHIVSKRDLIHIAKSIGVYKPKCRDADDGMSIDSWVRSYMSNDSSPFILYKRQGEQSFDIPPDDACIKDNTGLLNEDFLLGYMDSAQCEMLRRFGTGDLSVVCVDSTHGTNIYHFLLTTVMILDNNRQGFPVAFLFSTRETECVLKLFFRAIRSQVGIISVNSFMSDMAPQSYNAWRHVMGDSVHRLFCSWHVAKALKENTQRIADSEMRTQTYVSLHSVMTEHDVPTFEDKLAKLRDQLRSNESTEQFCNYFESNYLANTKSWAYCYRLYTGVNTNMSLERMHRTLKYEHLKGVKNKRLDCALKAVVDLVKNQKFERLAALCKGKYTKKLSELRKRHEHSVDMTACCYEMPSGNEWIVQSEESTYNLYTVSFCEQVCTRCDLRCDDCNMCIHSYMCTCPDNAIRFNMCKHIHLVCRKFPQCSMDVTAMSDSNHLVMADVDALRQNEIDALMADLSHSQPKKNDTSDIRESIRKLSQEIVHLADTVQDRKQLLCIQEIMSSVKPKVESIGLGIASLPIINDISLCKEPSNKKIEPQRRLHSIQRKPHKNRKVL